MEAKKLMAKCQTAIPVWIMPLAQVANNFNPSDNQFDVVIIDEASQADMLALPALYLGKKVIVVGDDQQVSPDAVGQNIDNMDALIKQYLLHVPNHHLFNEKQSIYDMASMANFSPIVLKEHFRCLPEIIAFSNELSYSGRIKPLRDASQVPITPPLVEYRVDGGTRGGDGKINKVEAEHIVSLIHAMLQNPKYRDQTIGVISMLGEDQAKYIDNLIQNSIPAEEYEQRRILCGTPPQFQGDERDVIFLSLVDGPKAEGGPLSLMDAESRSGLQKKRYNVAVSRAKNQLWVVHSLNPDIDLKSQDLRLRLISHARNFTKTALQLDRAESPFELEIMSALIQRGYNVVPQWQAGAFRIDIVVVSGMKKVAIECDGERYHTPEKLVEDMNRQAILERLGWRFIRIRGSKYYSNKQGTIAELFKELESREIVPSNTDSPEEKNGETNQTLIDELKRMAQEYRHSGKIVEVTMGFDETVETPQQIEAPEQIQQPIVDLPKVSPPTKEELPREGNTKKPLFDFRNNK
jgi:very-short-patch-repair endonuclease